MIDASAFSVSWNSGVAASSSCSGSEAHGPGPDFEQIEEEGRLARQSGQSGSLQGVGEGQAVGAGASASPDGRRDAAIGILASAVQFQFIACAQRYFPLKLLCRHPSGSTKIVVWTKSGAIGRSRSSPTPSHLNLH